MADRITERELAERLGFDGTPAPTGLRRADIRVDRAALDGDQIAGMWGAGALDLGPGRAAWDAGKASAFIESLALGIPAPPVWMYQSADGGFRVIDGRERLAALLGFLGGDFALRGTAFLGGEAEGATFDRLPAWCRLRIRKARIDCHVMDARMPDRAVWEVARRLHGLKGAGEVTA